MTIIWNKIREARLIEIVSVIAVTLFLASSSRATNVAGWDFSQYANDGALTTDGSTFTNTLSANYSDKDATANAGAESAAFGRMYMDGSFGSSLVSAGSEQVLPHARNTLANLDRSTPVAGTNGFNSFSVLTGEGQTFTQRLGMTALATSLVVFEADLSSTAEVGTGWSFSFAGKTLVDSDCFGACSSNVSVEFSADGTNYVNYGTVNLTDEETAHSVEFTSSKSEKAYVRLGFDPANGQPMIDNVAVNVIAVPEPASGLQLAAGLLSVCIAARRRNARSY